MFKYLSLKSLFRNCSLDICKDGKMECQKVWNVSDILGAGLQDKNYAMIVLNQPILSDPELIKLLWTKAKLRLTVDGGTNRWLQFIKENSAYDLPLPNCITGDFDSITSKTMQYFMEKLVKFVETPDQDETDFTKSLRELKSLLEDKQFQLHHILVLVTNSGRVDHIMANLETLHTAPNFISGIPIILMSSNSLTWLLNAKESHVIHVPEGYVSEEHSLGLIPLRGPTNVTTSGLKWDLENGRLAFGELVSTSNTFSKNSVKITCDQDLVWTVQFTRNES